MVSYDFYVNDYHGSLIQEEEFREYRQRAAEQLRHYERIYTVSVPDNMPDGRKRAVCAMAEALYGFDLIASGEGGPVQSAAIGSVSVSYGTAAQAIDISPKGQEKELYRCARRYLNIYRGARGCCG